MTNKQPCCGKCIVKAPYFAGGCKDVSCICHKELCHTPASKQTEGKTPEWREILGTLPKQTEGWEEMKKYGITGRSDIQKKFIDWERQMTLQDPELPTNYDIAEWIEEALSSERKSLAEKIGGMKQNGDGLYDNGYEAALDKVLALLK